MNIDGAEAEPCRRARIEEEPMIVELTGTPATVRTVAVPFSFPAMYISEPSDVATPLRDAFGPLKASRSPIKDVSEKSAATRTMTRETAAAFVDAIDAVKPVAL